MAGPRDSPPPDRDDPGQSPGELRAELRIALADRDRAIAQRDYYQQALQKTRTEHEKLQGEIARLRATTSESRARDESGAAAAAELKAQRDEARWEVESLRSELADLRVQFARLTTDRDEQRARADELTAAYQRASSNLESQTAQRDAGRAITDSLRKQIARLENEGREADRRVQAASDEIEFLRFTLDRSVTTYTKQRNDLERELVEARAQVRDLQHRLSQLEQPAASLLEWKARAIEAENKLAFIRERLDKPF